MLLNHYNTGLVEAGCDEAGRGCLAGSVYAAAVILPPDYHNDLLNDSKQLTEKRRYELRRQIESDAVAWAVGIVTPQEIDAINILRASFLAMHRAIDQLKVRPEALIIDGNRFIPYFPPADGQPVPETLATTPWSEDELKKIAETSSADEIFNGRVERAALALPHTTIVKGDAKYLSIAAASILAKTYRDDYMNDLAERYPQYDWLSNKGYPTKKHRMAIKENGVTPYHRLSYKLLPD